eukprot:scaffold565_cov358-Prasinococcus_capsulatus_cf.AAC.13
MDGWMDGRLGRAASGRAAGKGPARPCAVAAERRRRPVTANLGFRTAPRGVPAVTPWRQTPRVKEPTLILLDHLVEAVPELALAAATPISPSSRRVCGFRLQKSPLAIISADSGEGPRPGRGCPRGSSHDAQPTNLPTKLRTPRGQPMMHGRAPTHHAGARPPARLLAASAALPGPSPRVAVEVRATGCVAGSRLPATHGHHLSPSLLGRRRMRRYSRQCLRRAVGGGAQVGVAGRLVARGSRQPLAS